MTVKPLVKKLTCTANNCFLCNNCSEEWRALIDMKRNVLDFKKGEIIFKEGDPVTGIYFVSNGKIKVHKRWDHDKDYIVRLAREGDILGHRGYGGKGEPRYPISATALEDCRLCFIPTDFFFATLKANPQLSFELMMFYASELRLAEQRMRNLAHMSVKGRICEGLIMVMNAYGMDNNGWLNLNISRKDMAAIAGTTYESVIRNQHELVNEGIVELKGKRVRIIDEAELLKCAEAEAPA